MARLLYLILIFSAGWGFAAQAQAQDRARTPDAERLNQQIRAEERQADFSLSGLQWMSLSQAGKKVQDFLTKRDEFYKTLIGDGRYVDIAVYDMDIDSQPDIIVYFWDHCGFQGCLYKIYFGQDSKPSRDFHGWEFVPYLKGVMFDHAYFSL